MLAALCSLALAAAPGEPTDYAAFRAKVEALRPSQAAPFTLAVGVPNPAAGTYAPHCTCPAGYAGLASGVYDCFWDGTRAAMVPRAAPVAVVPPPAVMAPVAPPARSIFAPAPSPCPSGRCPLQAR